MMNEFPISDVRPRILSQQKTEELEQLYTHIREDLANLREGEQAQAYLDAWHIPEGGE